MNCRHYTLLRRAAAAAALAVAAIFAPLSATAQDEGDTITWALPGLPDTLLVPHAWSVNTGGVMSLVQEGLTAFSNDLALQKGVADEWEQVDDTTYVYSIRDGVSFHDGSPVTAEDVAYSMNWHLDPENGSQMAAFYSAVDTIEATGERSEERRVGKEGVR